MLNPIDLLHPGETAVGNIEQHDPIKSSELFEAFRKNERTARAKYIGKTFLIEGTILETYDARVDDIAAVWSWYMPHGAQNITPGIMLSPNVTYLGEGLRKELSGSSDFPLRDVRLPLNIRATVDVGAYEKLYAKSLKPDWTDADWFKAHRRRFSLYSDDFSFLSHFGGVYCMFKTAYLSYRYSNEQKTSIVAQCKIRDFLPGGLEEIPEYKRGFTTKTKIPTKPRVVAVGCIEISFETTSRY